MMRDLRSKEKLRASLGMTTERSIDLVPRRPVVARTSVPSHAGARQPRRARAPAAPASMLARIRRRHDAAEGLTCASLASPEVRSHHHHTVPCASKIYV
jgi:hypothetical protein